MQTERTNKPLLLITGCSGLIGTQVAKAFAGDFTVVGLDVKPPEEHTLNAFIRCDLTSDEDTARAFAEVRKKHGDRIASVIHLAAYYDFSGKPSPLYRDLTIEGTRRVLRALKTFDRVEQFVFTSTLLVMEPAGEESEVITEQSPLEDDPWAYPRSKIEAEEVIRAEHGAIPAVVLRIAGVYNEEGHSIPIAQHIARIYEKRFESYFFPGDPDHGTPYIHLNDLINCFRLTVDRRKDLDPYTVLLIAEPDIMSHEALQDTIGDLIHGKEWPTIRVPKAAARAGAWAREKLEGEEKTFIKPWMVDIADAHYPVAVGRAVDVLDWEPYYRLRSTLPDMLRRLKENPKHFYETNGLPLPDELQDDEPREEEAAQAENHQ